MGEKLLLEHAAYALVGPLARLWIEASADSWRRMPRPSDEPYAHAPGSHSDRLLLIGSGIAVGYGVISHNLGLAGNLAREISMITGRGSSVEVIADPDFTLQDIGAALSRADLSRFSGILISVGGLETASLMPRAVWRKRYEKLLDELQLSVPGHVQLFLIATSVPLVTALPVGMRTLVTRSSARLNAVTRELASTQPRTTFVDFEPPAASVGELRGRRTYREWAEVIAPVIADVLDEHNSDPGSEPAEAERLRAVEAVHFSPASESELTQLVTTVRDLFGSSGAFVSIVDGEQAHIKAGVGVSHSPVDRADAFCTLTVRHPTIFVVEDSTIDPRVSGMPWSSGDEVRFYAGYPIESPDGYRIGALCVVDSAPREVSSSDAALLRDLALRVQSILWGKGTYSRARQ